VVAVSFNKVYLPPVALGCFVTAVRRQINADCWRDQGATPRRLRHIVETGNKSYRFEHSTMAAKSRIKAREQTRKADKGGKGAASTAPEADPEPELKPEVEPF